jgi:hypothetical protein
MIEPARLRSPRRWANPEPSTHGPTETLSAAANVALLPLLGPGFSRELLLVTRRDGLSLFAPRIAEIARTTISAHAMPRISTLMPWFTATS